MWTIENQMTAAHITGTVLTIYDLKMEIYLQKTKVEHQVFNQM